MTENNGGAPTSADAMIAAAHTMAFETTSFWFMPLLLLKSVYGVKHWNRPRKQKLMARLH
ncbi:MAG: hypothetical protein WBQ57_11710 [Rhodanobacteraceae bacterium]